MNTTNINYEKVKEIKFAAASKVKQSTSTASPWFKEGVKAFYANSVTPTSLVVNPYSANMPIERSEFIRGYDSVASANEELLFDCD